MLKSADIKAIAKQVALGIYALNDEVLFLSDVAIKLSKSEAANSLLSFSLLTSSMWMVILILTKVLMS